MADYYKSLDGNEKSKLFNSFLEKAKDKQGSDGDGYADDEGYRMLAGRLTGDLAIFQDCYDNVTLPAWKAFAPKYAAKEPCPITRALIPSRKALAEAAQALFRYRIEKFGYTPLIMACSMDAWFQKWGVGYARHQWDDPKGITTTSRSDPKDVFWDYTASSMEKAGHVIERMIVKRGEFIKKFGKSKGWEVDAWKDSSVDWPEKDKKEHDGKTLLDQIEYFLLWSKEGGYKRVYAFTKDDDDKLGILNEDDDKDGEPWPIELGEDDWHLTQLRFTPIPTGIDGVSTYWAGRGQHNAYQRLNGSTYYHGLKAGKEFLFFPEELESEMAKIEKATRTINQIPYSLDLLQGRKIAELIEKFDIPGTPESLLQLRAEAKANWRSIVGVNAVQMLESQNLETATEAQTMQSSAANMIADDQGAVERFVTEIFRKELMSDLSRMPKQSVVCVKIPYKPQEDADEDTDEYEDEAEGEFEDDVEDEQEEKKDGEEYLTDVPYEEAILLERGVKSMAAAKKIAGVRQQVSEKAAGDALMQGVPADQIEQVQEQAAQAVPQSPEMQVRAARQIPMDAVCKIVNPGVEQFIGPEAAAGWVEGMTPRQIESEIGVSTERGSSSPMQRMQAVNEVFMLYNTVSPTLIQYGQFDVLAALINAAFKKSEIADLETVEVSADDIKAYVQQQQEAAQQAAQAEAAAKGQPQGPVPEDPNVMAKSKAEVAKAQIGHATQEQKTEQQKLKIVGEQVKGDVARIRDQSQAQLQMGGMMP